MTKGFVSFHFVIPAQAGIHSGWLGESAAPAAAMDSRLRGDDVTKVRS